MKPDPPADRTPDQPDQPHQTPGQPHEQPHDESGLDLARTVARGLAGKTGPARRRTLDRTGLTPSGRTFRRRNDTSLSGSHPDQRDPQTLDASLGRFVTEQGWGTELRVHGVFSRWEALVGREVGSHVTPESFADGQLTVRTDSTAWATQMTFLAAEVIRRLNEELGSGTVARIEVVGPRSPSWRRGRLRVKGRGPRDTYG